MAVNTLWWNATRYHLYAPFYNLIEPLFAEARRRSIELLELQKGEKILILGCGTGLDLEFLPKDCEITAVDLTPAMVKRTQKEADRLELNLKALVMNAQELDFESGVFDAVICHLILAVVPDPFSAASEAARVLKVEGRACILDKFLPDGQKPSWKRRVVNRVTSAVFSDINRSLVRF